LKIPATVAWWIAADDLAVHACHGYTPQGGFEVRVRSDAGAPWRTLVKAAPDEGAVPLGFSGNGRELFFKSSVASDTLRVIAIDIAQGGELKEHGLRPCISDPPTDFLACLLTG
jgi:hypothetical protein